MENQNKIIKMFGLYILQKEELSGKIKDVVEQFFGEDANECEEFELIKESVENLGYEFIFEFDDPLGHVVAIKQVEDDFFLFENKDLLPKEVLTIVEKIEQKEELDYPECALYLSEMKVAGYTFEYGLDTTIYDLRPMGDRELSAYLATKEEKTK